MHWGALGCSEVAGFVWIHVFPRTFSAAYSGSLHNPCVRSSFLSVLTLFLLLLAGTLHSCGSCARFHRATISRSAFMGRRAAAAPVLASKATVRMQQLPVFTQAMADFKAEYPDFAKRGWGATVKAEVRF